MAHDKKARAFTPMDLQTASFSTVTAMLHIDPQGDGDWECHGKFTSDKSGHAEEQLLDYLREDVWYDGDAKVVIELTTSPCGEKYQNCAGQLIQFMQNEADGRGIAHVNVKALGFYKGEQDAMIDATEIKSTQGMDFEIWDVAKEVQDGTTEGYDNLDSLVNFATASVYQLPKSGRKTDAFDKANFNQDKFGNFLFK